LLDLVVTAQHQPGYLITVTQSHKLSGCLLIAIGFV